MKKIIPIFIALFTFVACEKDPDTDKLDNNFVSTDYADGTDFSSFSTFYIPDSILSVVPSSAGQDTTFLTNANALSVIDQIVAEMEAKNYIRNETDKASAELGLQVSFIQTTYSFGIYGSPWYNSDYWGPYYWGGGWNNWYYPFPIVYSYNTGSLLIDMIDKNAAPTSKGMPIIWNAYISSIVNPNSNFNTTQLINGVIQAFDQSTYLNAN